MRSFLNFFRTIIRYTMWFFWWPIDFFVILWLTSYEYLNQKISFNFSTIHEFCIKNIPSVGFLYSELQKTLFFNWWFSKHIFTRLFFIYLFCCFLCSLFYSFYEIHLGATFEVLALLELTWILDVFPTNDPTVYNVPAKEEWTFWMHIMWSGLFLLVYFLQLILFTQLIFCFVTISGYFFLVYSIFNLFVFKGFFIVHAQEPVHIATLISLHLLWCVGIGVFLILCLRVKFVIFKFYNPSFSSNFFIYTFYLFNKKIKNYSLKFKTASFFRKIYLIMFWIIIINFTILTLVVFLQLWFLPTSSGEYLWSFITEVLTKVKTWDDIFTFNWKNYFRKFISLTLYTLYPLVFFSLASGSLILIVFFTWTKIIGFFLLVLYFPRDWALHKNYLKSFFNIFKFIDFLKVWIPVLRDYCYAASIINFGNLNIFLKGVLKRRIQAGFWKLHYRRKHRRYKPSIYRIFYDHLANNIGFIAGYKKVPKYRMQKNKSIWKISRVYGAQRMLIKKTKGIKGRFWFIINYYFSFFIKRTQFYYLKWKQNPSFIGSLIFNPSGYFTNNNSSSFYLSKIKLLFGVLLWLLYYYFSFLVWLCLGLIFYASIKKLILVLYPTSATNSWRGWESIQKTEIFLYCNLSIIFFLKIGLKYLLQILEKLFQLSSDIKKLYFAIHPNISIWYDNITTLNLDDEPYWVNMSVNTKLWFFLGLNISFLFFISFYFIFFILNKMHSIMLKLLKSISKSIIVYLILGPVFIVVDLITHFIYFILFSIIISIVFIISFFYLIFKLFTIITWNTGFKKQEKVFKENLQRNLEKLEVYKKNEWMSKKEFIYLFIFLFFIICLTTILVVIVWGDVIFAITLNDNFWMYVCIFVIAFYLLITLII